MNELSSTIMGEGGMCYLQAMIAIAWIVTRNPITYGSQPPSRRAKLVAEFWEFFPDPSHGAMFLFSIEDLKNPRVKQLIKDRRRKRIFFCKNGLRLYAY